MFPQLVVDRDGRSTLLRPPVRNQEKTLKTHFHDNDDDNDSDKDKRNRERQSCIRVVTHTRSDADSGRGGATVIDKDCKDKDKCTSS